MKVVGKNGLKGNDILCQIHLRTGAPVVIDDTFLNPGDRNEKQVAYVIFLEVPVQML